MKREASPENVMPAVYFIARRRAQHHVLSAEIEALYSRRSLAKSQRNYSS